VSEPMTDDGLFQLIAVGMLSGTPVLYLVAVGIAMLSGVGTGNALAIGAIPALFGGVTFGGFVGLMRHLRHEDKAEARAKLERRASAQAAAAAVPVAVAA
jgi:hypothetical protein